MVFETRKECGSPGRTQSRPSLQTLLEQHDSFREMLLPHLCFMHSKQVCGINCLWCSHGLSFRSIPDFLF